MVDILEGLYIVKRFKEHSNITTIDGLVYSGKLDETMVWSNKSGVSSHR